MTTSTRTQARLGAVAVAASVLIAGILAGPGALAAPGRSPVVTYVALGDSYAAGQGAGFYENACLQSDLSYPDTLDDIKHVKLIADATCTGATTSDVITSQVPAIKKNKAIDLVTLTIGANDLGGTGVVSACAASFTSPKCQIALAAALALLTPPAPNVPSKFAVRLAMTLTAVAAAAPGATILVTGYPYLFETPPPTDPNYTAISQINTATAALNTTIDGVVDQAAARRIDVRYVDVTLPFAGHGLGSPDPWIVATGPDAFHPTAAGHQAYYRALTAELGLT